jgi:hypothetical protein
MKTNKTVHAVAVPVPFHNGAFALSTSGRSINLVYLAASSDLAVFSLKLPMLLPKVGASTLSISGPAIVGGNGWILVGNDLVKVSLPLASGSVSAASVGVVTTVKIGALSGISSFLVATSTGLFVAGAPSGSLGGTNAVVLESVNPVSGSVMSSTKVRGSQVLGLVAGGGSIWVTSETQGGATSGPEVITTALNSLNSQVISVRVVSRSGVYALMATTPGRTWGDLFSGLAFAPSRFVVVPSVSTTARPRVVEGVLGEVNDAATSPTGAVVWTVGPGALLGFDSATLQRIAAFQLKGVLATALAVSAQSIWITANHEVVVVPYPSLK